MMHPLLMGVLNGRVTQTHADRKFPGKGSFEDIFELLAIEPDVYSEWMMFHGEDLGAHVQRKSDGKEFWPGLAELEAVDKKSQSYQSLNNDAVWFVNNR
jgi:hypothetical protein